MTFCTGYYIPIKQMQQIIISRSLRIIAITDFTTPHYVAFYTPVYRIPSGASFPVHSFDGAPSYYYHDLTSEWAGNVFCNQTSIIAPRQDKAIPYSRSYDDCILHGSPDGETCPPGPFACSPDHFPKTAAEWHKAKDERSLLLNECHLNLPRRHGTENTTCMVLIGK